VVAAADEVAAQAVAVRVLVDIGQAANPLLLVQHFH
jgi:hypothetical protein